MSLKIMPQSCSNPTQNPEDLSIISMSIGGGEHEASSIEAGMSVAKANEERLDILGKWRFM